MLISFVWLYVFKCDVYTQLLNDQTQKDFWVFYLFLKVFLCITFVLEEFFQKAKSVLLKNSIRGIFTSKSQVSLLAAYPQKWGSQFIILPKFYTESFATLSWDKASRETSPMHLRFFTSYSRVLCEYSN